MSSTTTSVRLSRELEQRLEEVSRYLHRGKNWIIVRALEEYLDKVSDPDFVEEARRQSQLASQAVTPDEEYWEGQRDETGWQP